MSYYYNNSFENLSNFAEVDNTSTLMNNILQTDITKEEPKKKSLTHRECILLYLNPDIGSKSKYTTAVEHIKSCKTCKNELSKSSQTETQNQKVQIIEPLANSVPVIQTTPLPVIEPEYKKIMMDEKNMTHQNLLIENTIAKYFDTIEEKKKLNDNIEKIMNSISKQSTEYHIIIFCLIILIFLILLDIFIIRKQQNI
jgi:hypothetical protein